MKFAPPLLAALIAASGFADNLVPEAKRALEVPFKGEGKMGMVYTPVFFPKGSEGAVISLEAKITDVVRGSQNWFDARVMSDFIDSSCKKVAGGPVIGGWKGTKDWFSVRKSVRIPSGAAGIALMPCLFNVKSGALEVRNLSVVAQDEGEPPSVQIDRHRRQPRLPDDMPADDGVGKPHHELRGHREGGRREKCPEFGTGERHPVR